MSIKLGKDIESIKKLAEKRNKMLDKGDITHTYAELMMGITPESLNVDKNNKTVINKMVEQGKEKIVELNISDLTESPKNCYSKPTGEKREELISSLKSYGQITPIFVRPKELVEEYQDKITTPFEILIGHSRVDCLKEIGKDKVKAIIVKCDDVEATLLIAQSNIQREKVTDLELARGYRNTYEALKKNNRGNAQVEKGKNENVEISIGSPKSQTGTSVRTDEEVAKRYGISKNTLHRKMALAYCTDKIVKLYEGKIVNQEQIQSIAKLSPEVQNELADKIEKKEITIDNDIIKKIYETFKATGKVDFNSLLIKETLTEEKEITMNKEPKVKKEKYVVPIELFPEGIKRDLRETYIIKALSYIREKKIEL